MHNVSLSATVTYHKHHCLECLDRVSLISLFLQDDHKLSLDELHRKYGTDLSRVCLSIWGSFLIWSICVIYLWLGANIVDMYRTEHIQK